MAELGVWLGLLGLGVYHGVNPGMGWLFAVALALQEKRRRAIAAALWPIALGHSLAVTAIAVPLAALQAAVPPWPLRLVAAAALLGFGIYRLRRARHPRWVGMRVGWRDLTVWSFLMASAHGAGLMLVPLLLAWPAATSDHHRHVAGSLVTPHLGVWLSGPAAGLAAVGLHTAGYLLAMALVAWVVYERVGLALLRQAWFNLDLLWAVALLAAGVLTLAL
jgi:hypothetical protein